MYNKVMEVVDGRYLAPRLGYKLHVQTPSGERVQKEKLIRVLTPFTDEVDSVQVPLLINEMQMCIKKRRQYHRKYWKTKNTHAPLKFGGRLPNSDSDSSVWSGDDDPKDNSPPTKSVRSKSTRSKKDDDDSLRTKKSESDKSDNSPPRSKSTRSKSTRSKSTRSKSTRSKKDDDDSLRTKKSESDSLFDVDVDSLFESSPDPPAPAPVLLSDAEFRKQCEPKCWDCGVDLVKSNCYPKSSWGDRGTLLFRCEKHWKDFTSSEIELEKATLNQRKQTAKAIRDKHAEISRDETPSDDVESDVVALFDFKCGNCGKHLTRAQCKPVQIADTPARRMLCLKCESATPKFKVHEFVDVKWESASKQFFRAFIVTINKKDHESVYDVYFPEDSEKRVQVPENEIHSVPEDDVRKKKLWSTNVNSYMGKTFKHDGQLYTKAVGVYSVLEISKGNKFKCQRVGGVN